MPLAEVALYLILKALASRPAADVLYDYFVRNLGVREVARKHNISKDRVRGYIERVREKSFCNTYRARAYIRVLYPHIKKIKPVIEISDGMCRCKLCGATLYARQAELHLVMSHRDIVASYLDAILEAVKEEWNNNRMAR